MIRFFARGAPLALSISVATIVVLTWFERGAFIATGDVGPFLRVGLLEEFGSLWNHQSTGAGSATPLDPQVLEWSVTRLTSAVGASPLFAQRLLFVFVTCAAVCATYWLIFTVTHHRIVASGVSCLAILNPLVMTQVPNLLPVISIAVMAGLAACLFRAAVRGKRSSVGLALISMGVALLYANPPLLLIAVAWIVVVACFVAASTPRGWRRQFSAVVRSLPLVLLFNLWWLAPALMTTVGGPRGAEYTIESDINRWAFTHARSTLPNVLSFIGTWAWPFPQYLPWSRRLDVPQVAWLRFVFPAFALVAPLYVSSERRRRACVLVSAAALLALGAKGLREPFGSVNRWLYEHVPGFILFREPTNKFGVALLLSLLVLAGLGAQAVVDRVGVSEQAWRVRTVLLVAGLVAAVAYVKPLWDGSLLSSDRPVLPPAHVRVPAMWRDASEHVNRSRNAGKVLVLPLNTYYQAATTWGFHGVDAIPKSMIRKPVIHPLPGGYIGESSAFAALLVSAEDAARRGDVQRAASELEKLGVAHVIVRRDVVGALPAPSVQETLHGIPGARLHEFGELSVVDLPNEVLTLSAESDFWSWRQVAPDRYQLDARPGPQGATVTVVLRETYSGGWRLTGGRARHTRADGYANAWRVSSPGPTLVIDYVPSRNARWFQVVSVGGVMLTLLLRIGLLARVRRTAGR